MEKVAVIGLGIISESHYQGWDSHPGVKLSAVVDIDPEKAKTKAKEWGAERWETDYHPILEDGDITICDVCLPHHLHASVTMDCLKAGKDVLCEKPIAMNLREAEAVICTWKDSGHLLMIAENWYYLPVVEKAMELLKNGEIGEIYYLQGNLEFDGYRDQLLGKDSVRNRGWRGDKQHAGGGILMDAGIHSISVARLFAGEVRTVWGIKGPQAADGTELEDTIDVSLKFDHDVLGQFHLAETAGRDDCRFDFSVYGTKGRLAIDILKQEVNLFTGGNIETFNKPAAGGMIEEINHFMDCLESGKKPLSDAVDQAHSLGVVLAAYESMRKNGTPVSPEKYSMRT